MDSEDLEELATHTLLSTEDVEMWVTHLDSVKKRRQAWARKAATRKQKSARQKSNDKVATAGKEFWCLCGGPESGNMITCDYPVALNVLFNIFKAITLQECSVAM